MMHYHYDRHVICKIFIQSTDFRIDGRDHRGRNSR